MMLNHEQEKKLDKIFFYKAETDSPVASHMALCDDGFDDQRKSATFGQFAGIAKPISGRVFESPLVVAPSLDVYYKTVTPEERGYSGYESSDIYFDDCGNEIYNEYEPVGVYNTVLVFSEGKSIGLVPPENLTSFCYYHQDLILFCSDGSYDKGEIKFQIRNHPERAMILEDRTYDRIQSDSEVDGLEIQSTLTLTKSELC